MVGFDAPLTPHFACTRSVNSFRDESRSTFAENGVQNYRPDIRMMNLKPFYFRHGLRTGHALPAKVRIYARPPTVRRVCVQLVLRNRRKPFWTGEDAAKADVKRARCSRRLGSIFRDLKFYRDVFALFLLCNNNNKKYGLVTIPSALVKSPSLGFVRRKKKIPRNKVK